MACLLACVILSLEWVTLSAPAVHAQDGVTVSGAITTNTTWKRANSPYHIDGNVTVNSHITLTIESGVEVIFDPTLGLRVEGNLVAEGTGSQPILFTSSNPVTNSWPGLYFVGQGNNRAAGDLAHVTVEYGGGGSVQSGNIYITNAQVAVRDSIIRNGGEHGIYGGLGTKIDIRNTSFLNNTGYAVKLDDLVDDPELIGLTASGNGVDGVGISDLSDDPQLLLEQSGLPYIVDNVITVGSGQELTVAPSVELRFAPNTYLNVHGKLFASGTPDQGIHFTAVVPTPGSWLGINFQGEGDTLAIGELQDAIVEYGGSGSVVAANIVAEHAYVTVRDSIIRHGGGYGVYLGQDVSSSVASSQIIDNAKGGIDNGAADQLVVAPDDWWGSASGPHAPNQCNPGGGGQSVSAGVLFTPFRTTPTEPIAPMPAVSARLVTITPQRWYAPTGFPVYVDVNVTDGNGYPVAGAAVGLSKAGGGALVQIADGSVTDFTGHTFALVTGQSTGDVTLVGHLVEKGCPNSLSAQSKMTITPAQDVGLLPDEKAPYLNDGLDTEPLPVERGVTTTVRATLVNDNNFTVTVAGQFSFAQSGIGLVFGPLKQFNNLVIPPHSQKTVEVSWLPSVTGHYCVRLDYTFTGEGVATVVQTRRAQRNFDVRPGPFLTPAGKNAAQKAGVANDVIGDGQYVVALVTDASTIPASLVTDQLFGNITDFIYSVGGGISCALGGSTSCSGWNGPHLKLPGSSISHLNQDPPRQDYDQIAPIDPITYTPLIPGPNLSKARAAALNELLAASLELAPRLIATGVSYDRYMGATAANDLDWASVQAMLYSQDLVLSTNSMGRVGLAYSQLYKVLVNEGVNDLYVTADDYRAYQQRLATQGFNATEVEAAHRVGLNDQDLEAIRQRRIALDPQTEASSLLSYLLKMSDVYLAAAKAMQGPPHFGLSGGGASPGVADISDQPPTHHLVTLNDQNYEVAIGNPTAGRATIDLRLRPVDLPPDWTAVVTPTQVTLDAGQTITAVVTIYPGLSTVADAGRTVAVEGYINNELLGGVALQLHAPHWVNPDAPWSDFMPYLERH